MDLFHSVWSLSYLMLVCRVDRNAVWCLQHISCDFRLWLDILWSLIYLLQVNVLVATIIHWLDQFNINYKVMWQDKCPHIFRWMVKMCTSRGVQKLENVLMNLSPWWKNVFNYSWFFTNSFMFLSFWILLGIKCDKRIQIINLTVQGFSYWCIIWPWDHWDKWRTCLCVGIVFRK